MQYFTTLFEVGYGPLELSDFRIGETPLAQYQDVEIEIREGRATDEPLTLYRNQVREDAFSVTITQAGGALIRETQVNADEFSLDLAWPRGLIWLPSDQAGINASGPQAPLSVDVKIEYRTAGSADPWTAAPNLINTVEYDTTAVTETSAPAGKKYVDYKTDNLIKGVICAGLTCPATLTTSSGTATLHGIKHRVYSRFEGSTEWKLQIDMEDYLEAGNSQTVELIGTQATKMEVRIERKAVAYNDTDTEPAANGGGYNAIPAPASWTYQGQSITDGTFTFTAEQHELLRRTILVHPAAQGKFEIRITRITLDIVKEGQDEFELAAIRTVTWASPLNVTGRALIALRIRATDQLHGMLDEVNCIGQAILPIYDKVGQTWSEAPTRNPAWARLEVLRGGAIGVTIADSRIDLDGHADFAALCDVAAPQSSLPDAINSDETEPHFTFDGVFDFDTTVFDTLRDIDATARAAHTMVDGKFSIVVDQAQSVPVAMITTKNSFGFRGTLVLSALPHALHVKFRDEARGFKDRTITVYADGYTALNATEFQDVEMFGVQRAAQAWRGGRYLLAHGNLRREVIEVSQDVENIVVTRGDLVELQHDVPRYGGESGRVKSVTVNGGGAATSMDVDEALQMTGGNSYAVRWRQSDSDQFEHAIDTATGGVTTVTFTTPVPAAEIPAIGDLFAFGEFDSVTERMLVHSIRHAGELRARLRLISEAPGVHTADQSALPILETTFNDDPMVSPPPVVEDLAATEVEILFGGDYRYDAHYTWRMPATGFAGAFEVYREIAGVFQLVDVIRQASYSFQNLAVGDTVKAAVVSVGPSGHKLGLSLAPSVVHTVAGSPPQDVLDFAGEVIGDKMRLSWTVRSTTRASHYRLRFTPKLVAAVWGDGADLGVPVPWPTAAVEVPARSGTYLIKAVDSNGVLSVNAKSVITTVPDALDLNVVSTLTEHPAFAGTHSYTAVVGGKVRLGSATAIGDWPDMSAITNMEYGPDGLALTGTYTLSGDFDLGDVYVSRITGEVLTTGINIEDSVGSWPDMSLIDDMGGSVNANHSVRLEIRTTEDNPAGAPVWTAWQTLVAGDYKARAGEFRAVMTTDDLAVTPEIEEITITVDMPDRIIAGKDLVTLTGSALTVAFSPALYALASNDVTVKDMASGDRLVITNETVNGFDAEVRDSGGSRVVRTFNHLTKGHGRIAA